MRTDSAETLCADVAKALDKGYPSRMSQWIHLTNEAYSQADPKILPSIYSVRLISFLYIEVMNFTEVMVSKQTEYEYQLKRLSHAPISNTYRRVAGIQCISTMDLVIMGEILVREQQETKQERQRHLYRIVASGKARLAKLHELTVRLQHHLPQYGNRILHYAMDVFTIASSTSVPSTKMELGDLNSSSLSSTPPWHTILPPGLHRVIPLNPTASLGGGGGGGSLSWDNQRVPPADASSRSAQVPSTSPNSSRSVSPDIPSPTVQPSIQPLNAPSTLGHA